jgi:exodeoxyribonuclease VII large subunit
MHSRQPEPPVLSVSGLTRRIKQLLESEIGHTWVEGEIINLRTPASGHLYFTLTEGNTELASVMFRSDAARCPIALQDGMRVQCHGRVTVYEPRGRHQIIVDQVRPAGDGALLAALEKMKRRLEEEGLFDPALRKPLPAFPGRVGIITSPTGAAVRDILRVLHDRFPVPVLIHPAAVQGPHAPAELVRAVQRLDTIDDVDVIVIGRGGGSLEDLWAFNNEALVRAIHAASTPIISAVGHEVDFLLTDLVADKRAPTPTAAAEMAVPLLKDIVRTLDRHERDLRLVVAHHLDRFNQRLAIAMAQLGSPDRRVQEGCLRLDEMGGRLQAAMRVRLLQEGQRLESGRVRVEGLHPTHRIRAHRARVSHAIHRLENATRACLTRLNSRVHTATAQLDALGPQAILDRGYAVVLSLESGAVIRDAESVQPGMPLDVRVARGSFQTRVTPPSPPE